MHFYTQSEKEVKKTVLLSIASKRINYPGIRITKEVKDSYTKNYKAWLKEEFKEELN